MTASPSGIAALPVMPRPVASGMPAPVLDHVQLGPRHRRLSLHAPRIAADALPGQFVMLTAAAAGDDTPVLPRPMAIYSTDPEAGSVDIVYAVRGTGTRRLSEYAPGGEPMFVVGPLGRGFEIGPSASRVLLIGRGIGACSLTTVAQAGRRRGFDTVAVTSARTPADLVGREVYERSGALAVHEVTDAVGDSDPEALWRMLAGELDANPPQLVLTCGSDRLARLSRRLADRWGAEAQVSLEAHMACGLGYCHGCATGSVERGAESPLICVDGPVFELRA